MNAKELLGKVCTGHVMLVGELRAADVKESGQVDKKSGLAMTTWLINYFVELPRADGLRFTKITKRMPRDVHEPAVFPVAVEKGRCYAFEIDLLEWKNGILSTRMGTAEPALIDSSGGEPFRDAPQKGSAMNGKELLWKVCTGHKMVVGGLRAAVVKRAEQVDKKSRLTIATWLINYFVELPRGDGFRFAKITRRMPRDVQNPVAFPVGVEKGRCYAFELDLIEWKNGILSARMGISEPALIDANEGAPSVDAPQGAASDGVPLSLV